MERDVSRRTIKEKVDKTVAPFHLKMINDLSLFFRTLFLSKIIIIRTNRSTTSKHNLIRVINHLSHKFNIPGIFVTVLLGLVTLAELLTVMSELNFMLMI